MLRKSFVSITTTLLTLSFVVACASSKNDKAETRKATMEAATQELRESGITAKAIKVGDRSIDFTLPSASGISFKLSQALKKGPVVLSFYRGGWCPYCNEQLQAYQARLKDFQARGAQLVAISPDSPQSAQDTASKKSIEFVVLSDADNKTAEKYGLVFQVGPEIRKIYEDYGLDLTKAQGNDRWRLPVPATYVIAQDGRIAYSYLDVDYTSRAKIDDILASLDKLQ